MKKIRDPYFAEELNKLENKTLGYWCKLVTGRYNWKTTGK